MTKIGKTKFKSLCKISKKSNEPILNNIQKKLLCPTAPFCHFSIKVINIIVNVLKWYSILLMKKKSAFAN